MQILITGASGLLGSAVAKAAVRRKHQVIGIVGKSQTSAPGLSKREVVDLEDLADAERFVLDTFPDAIVNCAAISIPRLCDQSPERTRRLNVDLPEKLALLARHLFAKFVHVSSDMVFNGRSAPYAHDQPTSPLSEYGRQKAESERLVLEMAPDNSVVIRLPLINGNSPSGIRSLHEMLFDEWKAGRIPPLFENEYRQPVSVDNAADMIVEILERDDIKGLHHWAGESRLSRFEIGAALLRHFGLPSDLIAKSRNESPNRPEDLSLDLSTLRSLLKTPVQSFAAQLDSLIVPPPHREWYHRQ